GEPFLAATRRLPADVLVVEGWIGEEGIEAAAGEFKRGNYRLVVATGGLNGESWNLQRWSYAEIAIRVLHNAGIPADKIIPARAADSEAQRTFAMAVATARALQAA